MILSLIELSWDIGLVISAGRFEMIYYENVLKYLIFDSPLFFFPLGLGWIILPLDINISIASTDFLFHSWNFYLLICSFPAPIAACWLVYLPETPKYLGETGQNVELIKVLTKIYQDNTGRSPEDYLVKINLF